ncbi:trehalase [Sporodiniella umbellata]|nr:trehalase [Sporodiniella umbellata]
MVYSLRILSGLLLSQLALSALGIKFQESISCDSPIYCEGPILKTVQLAELFSDSKTFVDMPTTKSEKEVIEAFHAIGGTNATKDQIQQFVKDNFAEAGTEVKMVTKVAVKENIEWINDIKSPDYQGWINHLNQAWGNLTFKFDYSSLCKDCVSSTLPVKREFVVPGGRFREFYYWDSYFVIEGLLLSDQIELAKNMIENFFDFVDRYGFVPNGARIYYLNRSQPPFLSLMVKSYYEKTKDRGFMKRALTYLDKEYTFWMKNTAVKIQNPKSSGELFTLNQYVTQHDSPRPESYLEDYNTVNGNVSYSNATKAQMYKDIAAGAESGWDYSTRWTISDTPSPNQVKNYEMLRTINTHNIVPIDLNSLLWSMEDNLSKWYKNFGSQNKASKKKSRYYAQQAKKRLAAIDQLMWDENTVSFYDFNITSNSPDIDFTPATLFPFWLNAIPERLQKNKTLLSRTMDETEKSLRKYPGILTTSYHNSTMQWDLPNGWPPLTYIAIQSLLNMDKVLNVQKDKHYTTSMGTEYNRLAIVLADRYAASAYCGWYSTGGSIPDILPKLSSTSDDGHMFEKFDVTQIGVAGGNGEYKPQVGFGWTNGVAMWIFDTFNNLTAPENCTHVETMSI